MCDALHYLLGIVFIRFGSKLYRQNVQQVFQWVLIVLRLSQIGFFFLFCYERDFMLSMSDHNQTDIIEAFNSTSRYLDALLNIDNPYYEKNGRSDISH